MKIITISQVGYNHPSQANWSYKVYKLDLIDTDLTYCTSYLVKSAFTEYQTIRKTIEDLKHKLIETSSTYASTGKHQNITGISQIPTEDSETIINEIKLFLK